MELAAVLFCHEPGRPAVVDSQFEQEAVAARACGLEVFLVDHDAAMRGRFPVAIRKVPSEASGRRVLYRGWMMPAAGYAGFVAEVEKRGWSVLTSGEDYAACHHLVGWVGLLGDLTPQSRWIAHAPPFEPSEIADALREWTGPAVVKDYVKSEKHAWSEACFIPEVTDLESALRIVNRFIALRGNDFEGGLVIREFVPLVSRGVHPQSGMPLSNELRSFWMRDRCIAVSDYWGGSAPASLPSMAHQAAKRINRPFFAIDLAERQAGGWIVMEVGDGQVSSLADGMPVDEFYRSLVS
jgi:hypothetical protein